jgi:hypothetical protein
MQIKNFNRPVSEAGGMLGPVEVGEAPLGCDAQPHTKTPPDAASDEESQAGTEILLLRARIEHLELVVETARSLMTSNQERLLRRLHDVPHELMRLTAKMTHHAASDLGGTARASNRASVPPLTRNLP